MREGDWEGLAVIPDIFRPHIGSMQEAAHRGALMMEGVDTFIKAPEYLALGLIKREADGADVPRSVLSLDDNGYLLYADGEVNYVSAS